MIWTRPVDNQPMAGRLVVAHAIRQAIADDADVVESTLLPALGGGAPIWRAVRAALSGVSGFLRRQPLPLQCALYADPVAIKAVLAAIHPATDVVYLDGIRTLVLLRALRARFPDMRIVVDLDDLMSRRMRLLLQAGETLSPGFLLRHLPAALVRWATSRAGLGMVRYEAITLPAAERETLRLADAVVLLSDVDLADLYAGGRAERVAIRPSVPQRRPPQPLEGPLRFVFVGTDVLTQNRLTIDYLIGLWRLHAFDTELVIYGTQVRAPDLPRNVRFAGYVDDIAEAYAPGSVMLTPAFLRGGVKTKVLEAFSYGVPVIGNDATFEAMPLAAYPLRVESEPELVSLLKAPGTQRRRLVDAAEAGAAYLRKTHDPDTFNAAWRKVLHLT